MPSYTTVSKTLSFKLKATALGGITAITDDIKIKLRNCDNLAPEIIGARTIEVEADVPTTVSIKSSFNSSEPLDCPVNTY